jgi:GTP cyclohydrolase II
MRAAGDDSSLFGSKGHTSVSRGLAEFHGRRPVLVAAPHEVILALPVEGIDDKRLAEFRALCAPATITLVITARRALAIGIDAKTPMALALSASDNANSILALAANGKPIRAPSCAPANNASAAAIQLAKLAQDLPAVLVAAVKAQTIAAKADVVTVEAGAVIDFAEDAIQSLTIASEAQIPLSSGTRTRFIVFRDAMGGTPVAIIVGEPDFAKPVPVRLHSACLTGDVFGSRRCDCGEQLRLAVRRLGEIGGGIVLYLAQEGRGVGLVNKMRTYQLQDEGLDTVDANTTLGFDDDEREYGVAARMLQMLNCTSVVLLTNNPLKLDGLAKGDIEIAGRMPLEAPIHADNRRYLAAKATRAGHRLDHLLASLAEPS